MEGEGIYLLREREFVRLNEDVYKIGRSKNIKNRMNNYPKGSSIELMMGCQDSVAVEKALLDIFRKKFIPKTEYGAEYFYGDKQTMIRTITDFINSNGNKVLEIPKQIPSVPGVAKPKEIITSTIYSTPMASRSNTGTCSSCINPMNLSIGGIGLYTNDMNILEYKDTLYWIDKSDNIYEIVLNNQLGKKIGKYDIKQKKIITNY